MKNGIYKYTSDDYIEREDAHIIVEFKETDKTYSMKVIENTLHYPNGNIEMLLLNKGKAIINKLRNPHGMICEEDYFVLYPYRSGIPFLFILVEEIENK